MPKSKNYKTPRTPNAEYKNQISPTSEYKNKNIKSNKLATTGKLINSSSNSDNSQNSQTFIVIAKSTCHNLLMYMDEKVEKFINREEPLEIAHESIAKAAKLLIQNDFRHGIFFCIVQSFCLVNQFTAYRWSATFSSSRTSGGKSFSCSVCNTITLKLTYSAY